jgi:hypothetical protein
MQSKDSEKDHRMPFSSINANSCEKNINCRTNDQKRGQYSYNNEDLTSSGFPQLEWKFRHMAHSYFTKHCY